MVSVAIATYNGEKYIYEQLESIYKQIDKADEIIIFDDCSTDKTVEIIERFINDKNARNILMQKNDENKGFVQTFKKAILKTRGEIIFLSDQDDIWNEEKVEKVLIKFKQDNEILAINSDYELIDASSKKINKKKIIKKGIDFNTILKGNISPGCTMAFRSIIKKDIENMNRNIHLHDWFINIISASKGKVVYINEELIKYRIHGNNTIGKSLTIISKYTISKRINNIKSNMLFLEGISQMITCDNYKLEIEKQIKFNEKRLKFLAISRKRDVMKYIAFLIKNFRESKKLIGDIYYKILRPKI